VNLQDESDDDLGEQANNAHGSAWGAAASIPREAENIQAA